MTFEEAYALDIGTVVSVSDGKPAPPETSLVRFNVWRSNNFTGAIQEKIPNAMGSSRALRIADANVQHPVKERSYTIVEGHGHTFTTE